MREQETKLASVLKNLEGDECLMAFTEKYTGLSIWPFIRHQVLFHLIFTAQNFASVGKDRNATRGEIMKTLFFSFWKNPFWLIFKKPSILIFSSGIANVLNDGKYFNRLADYFYYARPNETALIESTSFGKHLLPRMHGAVYSRFFVRMVAMMMVKLRIMKSYVDEPLRTIIAEIRSKTERTDADEKFYRELQAEMHSKLPVMLAEYRLYRWLFRKVSPKLVIVEDGSYGYHAYINVAAKDNKIAVAEYQHGLLNSQHITYNVGPGIRESKLFRKFIPDYFLSYGAFWSNSINLPAEKVDIGNPHLSESVTQVSSFTKRKAILFLGVGVDPGTTIATVLGLHERYTKDGFAIIFRPHPLEWVNSDEVYRELIDKNIPIDKDTKIYESIQQAEIVIGELSTAIYEAAAFGANVYVVKNAFSESFGDASVDVFPSLEEGIRENFENYKKPDSDIPFWQPGWKERYAEFVDRFLPR